MRLYIPRPIYYLPRFDYFLVTAMIAVTKFLFLAILKFHLFITILGKDKDKIQLNIMGFFPWKIEQGWDGSGIRPAVEMAFQDINQRNDILEDYTLTITINDTRCLQGQAVKLLFEKLTEEAVNIAIVNMGCSVAMETLARTAPYFNLVQIDAAASSPVLSDLEDFPYFVRTSETDMQANAPRVAFMQEYGWKRVATIHQNEDFFSLINNGMVDLLEQNNISLITSEVLINAENELKILKDKDARIIVYAGFEGEARKLFCEVYRQGLYGKNYVWMTLGWYQDDWWRQEDDTIVCTKEMMDQVVNGSISMSAIREDKSGTPSISGMTFKEFEERYYNWSSFQTYGYNSYHSTGYDAVWTLALGLNRSIEKLSKQEILINGSYVSKRLEHFAYDDANMSKLIYEEMKSVSFQGVSGFISFEANGDRKIPHTIDQLIDGKKRKIATFYFDPKPVIKFDEAEHSIIWFGEGVPIDGKVQVYEKLHNPISVFMAFTAISSIGIIVSIFFMIFNTAFRNHRYVKLSSPRLNSLIIVGGILAYLAVILQGIDGGLLKNPSHVLFVCMAESWFLSLSFTFSFGTIFLKTWRVHSIWSNRKRNKKMKIQDGFLIGLVGGLVLIDIVILTAWLVIDPFTISLIDAGELSLENSIHYYTVETCGSKYYYYWMGALYMEKGLMLAWGCLLAFETRNITIEALNDSRYLSMCVYNVVILSILAVTISLTVDTNSNVIYIIESVIILICATVTLCFLFIPKIIEVVKNPSGDIQLQPRPGTNFSTPQPKPTMTRSESTTVMTTCTVPANSDTVKNNEKPSDIRNNREKVIEEFEEKEKKLLDEIKTLKEIIKEKTSENEKLRLELLQYASSIEKAGIWMGGNDSTENCLKISNHSNQKQDETLNLEDVIPVVETIIKDSPKDDEKESYDNSALQNEVKQLQNEVKHLKEISNKLQEKNPSIVNEEEFTKL